MRMFRRKQFTAVVIVTLLVACMVGGGPVWASDSTSSAQAPESILVAQADALSDDEMREISGESWQVGAVILLTYLAQEAFDYSDASEWLQGTAFPAIESAGIAAYEATKEAVTTSLETIGEASMNNPYMWMTW